MTQPRLLPLSLLAFAALAACHLFSPAEAAAQSLDPRTYLKPNVMILLDTSGSMMWPSDVQSMYPWITTFASKNSTNYTCDSATDKSLCQCYTRNNNGSYSFQSSRCGCGANNNFTNVPDKSNKRSRMMVAQEVLTGRFYENLVASACVTSPTGQETVLARLRGDRNTFVPQYDDGMLDLYREHVKFSLMTFDSDTDTGTAASNGYSWGPNATANRSDYNGTYDTTIINYLGTTFPKTYNLGAKHDTSPIGALVSSGFSDDFASIAATNQKVQTQIITATAENGTPTAALMYDARHYYNNHCDERDPTQTCSFGGSRGKDVYAACRPKAAIVVADGGDSYHECYNPNTRSWLNSNGGVSYYSGCYPYPFNIYQTADIQAEKLLQENDIKTYVIGFGPDVEYDQNLRRMAFKGGTCDDINGPDCYFKAENFDEMYEAMTRILSEMLATSTSRSRSATTSRTSFRDDNVGMYEVSASFRTTPGDPFWYGSLERVTYACDANSDLVPTEVKDFADGLKNRDTSDRQLLTSTASLASGSAMPKLDAARASDGSLLFPTCTATQNDQVLVRKSKSRTGGTVYYYETPSSADYIVFPGGCQSNTDCPTANGTTYACLRGKCEPTVTGTSACTDTLNSCCTPGSGDCNMMCYAGSCKQLQTQCTTHSQCDVDSNGDGTIDDLDTQNRVCHLGTCTRGWRSSCVDRSIRRQPLGDIAHSNPLIVVGPELDLPIPSYQAFRQRHGNRDTMVYVGANDGMLHSFLLGELTPKADFQEGDEVWAYIPQTVQSRLGNLRYGREVFVDGSAVAKDIRLYNGQYPDDLASEWRTVLIGSLRAGGRAYFALDVTDPYNPKYLWEVNSDKAGFDQLGLSYGEAAMGMVTVIGGDGKPVEKAVAILSGGVPSTTSTTQGKAVFVVDLATGQLLRKINTLTGTTSPMNTVSGAVTAFNAFPGAVLSRAFMGDSKGRLLRLDLSKTDPLDWTLSVFYDPLPQFGTNASLEPVLFPPAVALNSSNQLVVLYGNGNVDNLASYGTNKHFAISLTEEITIVDGVQEVNAALNWITKFDNDGEKMTSSPTIFNSVAYFSTFVPNDLPCDFGYARLYAADFDTGSSLLRPVAAHSLDQNTSTELSMDFATGTVILGVEVANRPSCVPSRDNQTPPSGGGSYQANPTDIKSSKSQSPQLILHTGAKPFGDNANGSAPSTTNTPAVEQKVDKLLVDLPQPDRALKALSWSAVYM
jgi:hypothetical protein